MIVYASILLPGAGWHRLATEPVAATADMAGQVTQGVTTAVGSYCRVHVTACVEQAAQLNALVKSTMGEDSGSPRATLPQSDALAPLPVRRPRKVRAAVLTHD